MWTLICLFVAGFVHLLIHATLIISTERLAEFWDYPSFEILPCWQWTLDLFINRCCRGVTCCHDSKVHSPTGTPTGTNRNCWLIWFSTIQWNHVCDIWLIIMHISIGHFCWVYALWRYRVSCFGILWAILEIGIVNWWVSWISVGDNRWSRVCIASDCYLGFLFFGTHKTNFKTTIYFYAKTDCSDCQLRTLTVAN